MQTLIRLQALVALAVCIWVILFFGARLHTIAQMRKTIPGRHIASYQVTRKWENPGSRRRGPSYWISWAPGDRLTSSDNSVMMDQPRWQRLRTGDSVTIARGSIEGIPYEVH